MLSKDEIELIMSLLDKRLNRLPSIEKGVEELFGVPEGSRQNEIVTGLYLRWKTSNLR